MSVRFVFVFFFFCKYCFVYGKKRDGKTEFTDVARMMASRAHEAINKTYKIQNDNLISRTVGGLNDDDSPVCVRVRR